MDKNARINVGAVPGLSTPLEPLLTVSESNTMEMASAFGMVQDQYSRNPNEENDAKRPSVLHTDCFLSVANLGREL